MAQIDYAEECIMIEDGYGEIGVWIPKWHNAWNPHVVLLKALVYLWNKRCN